MARSHSKEEKCDDLSKKFQTADYFRFRSIFQTSMIKLFNFEVALKRFKKFRNKWARSTIKFHTLTTTFNFSN